MKNTHTMRLLAMLFFSAIFGLALVGTVHGQFTQNRDAIKVDASSFPIEIQKDYRLFRTKCNECHGLDKSLKLSLPPAQWTSEVKRMQAMASSQFNNKQAAAIAAFLNYYQEHRKASGKPAAASAVASSGSSAGRQFYEAQNCDTCHKIAGSGGAVGPDLTDVGNRLSREKLVQLMQSLKSGKNDKMPPLPPETTEEQIRSLVDYLLTLKGS
ncbi:MAG TPA: c-type cytochrome [Candidatus Acidoferrum sp.]|nr:c-type cytochrome [Candidatus Acidoferrum sp.]